MFGVHLVYILPQGGSCSLLPVVQEDGEDETKDDAYMKRLEARAKALLGHEDGGDDDRCGWVWVAGSS